MGFFAILLIVLAVLVIGLYYIVYVPIPAGYSQPLKLQMIYSTIRVIRLASALGEKLGYGPKYVIFRKIMHGMDQAKKRRAEKDESLIITDARFDDVPVRVYTPKDKPTMSTGLVYFHGGGGIFGSVDGYDSFTGRLAKSINTVVVSVEYRLAPEHIFPAAFDDCVAATKFFVKNAADFGVDATRIGVAGDSTGGNLTAITALKLRDDGVLPPLKMQVLLYPAVQFANLQTPSYQRNATDGLSGMADVAAYRTSYFLGHTENASALMGNLHTSPDLKAKLASTHLNVSKLPEDMVHADYVPGPTDVGDPKLYNELESILLNPYACPLLADDLRNLPMAYVFTGHNDVLRDEGVWYVQRLREVGVLVKHRHSEIAFHGIFTSHGILPEASTYTDEVVDFVKNNL